MLLQRPKVVARTEENFTSVIREKLSSEFLGNAATPYGIANEQ